MWKNGSAEAEHPSCTTGYTGPTDWMATKKITKISADFIIGPGTGVGAWAWGGEAAGSYWSERYFLDRVLENYKGSVYLIQGMHDWNVDPHMAVQPSAYSRCGIEARGLFGQWDHDYPDRPVQLDDRATWVAGVARPSRKWFATIGCKTLEWFDYYLKDIGDQPGQWLKFNQTTDQRIEDRYPPNDVEQLVFALGDDMSNIAGSDGLASASTGPVWQSNPLTENLHIAGMPFACGGNNITGRSIARARRL